MVNLSRTKHGKMKSLHQSRLFHLLTEPKPPPNSATGRPGPFPRGARAPVPRHLTARATRNTRARGGIQPRGGWVGEGDVFGQALLV